MKQPIEMRNLYEHETDAYNLEGFKPQIVDAEYLKQLGVTIEPSEETLQGLIRGSKLFMKRLEEHTVIPKSVLYLEDCDPETVENYMADPLCGFIPCAGLFTDMMGGIQFIGAAKNIRRMRKDLPVFFISGDKDPVGENGKGVIRVYNAFLAAGMTDVTMKLYHDCRHELLNELNRDEVMKDILDWLASKLPQQAE